MLNWRDVERLPSPAERPGLGDPSAGANVWCSEPPAHTPMAGTTRVRWLFGVVLRVSRSRSARCCIAARPRSLSFPRTPFRSSRQVALAKLLLIIEFLPDNRTLDRNSRAGCWFQAAAPWPRQSGGVRVWGHWRRDLGHLPVLVVLWDGSTGVFFQSSALALDANTPV